MKRMLISSVALQVNKSEEYLLGMVNSLQNKHKERDKHAQGKGQTRTRKRTNEQEERDKQARGKGQTSTRREPNKHRERDKQAIRQLGKYKDVKTNK